jgi:hypothetical protein
MTTEPTKTCKICAQVKLLSLFPKHKEAKDGHLNFCKVCKYAEVKAYRTENSDDLKAKRNQLRDSQGRTTREKYLAKIRAHPMGIPETSIAREARVKAEEAENKKRYYAANKEQIKAKKAAHRKTEAYKKTQSIWVEKNRAVIVARVSKRNAAKLKRTPAWLTEFDLLKIKCLYQLAAMRNRESGYDWHVDHIIPLQGEFVSGLHVPNNLRVIPAVDNRRKNNLYEV